MQELIRYTYKVIWSAVLSLSRPETPGVGQTNGTPEQLIGRFKVSAEATEYFNIFDVPQSKQIIKSGQNNIHNCHVFFFLYIQVMLVYL